MNEGLIALRRDDQVAYFAGDGASISSERFSPGSTFIVSPGVSQRRNEIE